MTTIRLCERRQWISACVARLNRVQQRAPVIDDAPDHSHDYVCGYCDAIVVVEAELVRLRDEVSND
jgi:hypothetical protein